MRNGTLETSAILLFTNLAIDRFTNYLAEKHTFLNSSKFCSLSYRFRLTSIGPSQNW